MLVSSLSSALQAYVSAISAFSRTEDADDLRRIAAIANDLAAALDRGDHAAAKRSVVAFSRQVSDSYAEQPPEFKALAQAVQLARKSFVT